ncbi:RNA-directed DNA polymerase, partial [Listeria innocua]|nr:RNA-directed DNA polymerase [Listeria innocua]
MSLVHPIAQLQMFQYILKYEDLVTSFCRNSQYSVRAPIKRNIPKTSEQELRVKEILKLEEEFSLVDKISVTSEEDKILFYNYFTYRRYTRIKDLYSSPKFNRDKYKYKFFLKLDIQQFFPSIYTHSLSWALFGDKSVAKKYKGNLYKSAFPNASDMIAQIINFNETHGLIIGPEFSRIIAELLLTRVDIDLHARLR